MVDNKEKLQSIDSLMEYVAEQHKNHFNFTKSERVTWESMIKKFASESEDAAPNATRLFKGLKDGRR